MSAPAPVIIGAGPAGLSAAIQLAAHSVKSVLIDEAPKVGGVVFRGPLRAGVSLDYLGDKYKRSMEKLHADFAAHAHLFDVRLNTRVIGAEDERILTLDERERIGATPFEELVLATGCHERSIPFPGWTLPGVMLLGGLQLQIKSGAVKPRGPVVIAGTGPLLPLVACQLCQAGVEVAGVFEACSFNNLAREVVALLNKPQLLLDGLSMLATLKQHGVPVRYGWGIVEARGTDEVEQVVVAPYDGKWHPDLARAETMTAGTVAAGYGFLPRTQLSQLIGLDHVYRDDGSLAAQADAALRGNRQDIYVAGDLAGIKGGEAAMLQGKIAALGILERRGVLAPHEVELQRRQCQRQLHRIVRFRAAFERIAGPGAGMAGLPQPDTPVCRCENVTRAQIDCAIAQGVEDLISLKMRTRAGMGDCQGKMCVGYCVDRLRQATGRSDVGWTRPRFPLDPIPFGAFSALDNMERHE